MYLLIVLLFVSYVQAEERVFKRADMAVLGIQPGGKLTLDDVVKQLGRAVPWQEGDASTSATVLCYLSPRAGGFNIVEFTSFNETANPPRQVNAISLYADKRDYPDSAHCAKLSLRGKRLVSANGLALRMTVKEVESRLGKAKRADEYGLHYGQNCEKRYLLPDEELYKRSAGDAQCFKDPTQPFIDECSSITVKYVRGRVVRLTLAANQSFC
jgi:hypothetical protein